MTRIPIPPTLRCAGLLRLACAMLAALALHPALADGAVYVGSDSAHVPVFVQVEIGDDMQAEVRLRTFPNPGGRSGLTNLDAAGAATASGATVVVQADAAPPVAGARAHATDAQAFRMELHADAMHGGALDPHGGAQLVVHPDGDAEATRVSLLAAGTIYARSASLADGSFEVLRRAPFFYADPWRELDLAGRASRHEPESLATGLQQRRDLPDSVAGNWSDEVIATVEALSSSAVSVLFSAYTYTGGAHPNTFTWSAAFVRGAGGWREASLCDLLGHVGAACDREAMRQAVVSSLRDQEAAWVVQGEVDVSTPWLLGTFTLTGSAVRFHFSPYDVGPYAQGPFVVDVPLTFPQGAGAP